MLETIMAATPEEMSGYGDTVVWCALKYALCMDEGEATEAVIHILWPRIPILNDQMFSDVLTAVESYMKDALTGVEKKAFVPAWRDVLARLYAERDRRIQKAADDES